MRIPRMSWLCCRGIHLHTLFGLHRCVPEERIEHWCDPALQRGSVEVVVLQVFLRSTRSILLITNPASCLCTSCTFILHPSRQIASGRDAMHRSGSC